MISLSAVTENDIEFWLSVDGTTKRANLEKRIAENRGYIIYNGAVPIGVIAYNMFWDKLPFLSLIKIAPEYRRCGFGRTAISLLEDELRKLGYRALLVSTQTDEEAQHFYRKTGYKECGCLVLNEEPLKQPMEMFFIKTF